jgi:small subunit ribosomal protein S19e
MLNTPAGWPRRSMTHPNDVPTSALLPKLAAELKSRNAVVPPPWADFVKTGVHKERAPHVPDWWYLRSASVLRKIYLKGNIGVTRLAAEYGGKRDRGSAPYHAHSGSGSIAREIVQQLEKSGLVQRYKTRGRRVTAEGQKLLDTVSRDILQGLAAERPALAKYL